MSGKRCRGAGKPGLLHRPRRLPFRFASIIQDRAKKCKSFLDFFIREITHFQIKAPLFRTANSCSRVFSEIPEKCVCNGFVTDLFLFFNRFCQLFPVFFVLSRPGKQGFDLCVFNKIIYPISFIFYKKNPTPNPRPGRAPAGNVGFSGVPRRAAGHFSMSRRIFACNLDNLGVY